MIIGIPKEIKKLENRVSLLPGGAEALVKDGHQILVERNAGVGSGFPDEQYVAAGAEIVETAAEVFERSEMIVKVKEPQAEECEMIRDGQLVFTYFHFASSKALTDGIQKSGCIAIAYETIEKEDGSLPLLTPMSEVAGRMAVQLGARYLQRDRGGRGLLLGGVPGVDVGNVLVIGGGAVGSNAARMAAGLGANVYVLDLCLDQIRYLSDTMPANVTAMMSNEANIKRLLKDADLVVNGVLVAGAKAPKLISREDLRTMKPGSCVVDVAIDQGGGLETSRPTDHENPTYVEEGIIHYCVTNMPGAVPVTSTHALTNATWPYLRMIANSGFCKAIKDPAVAKGVNMVHGKVTHPAVAEAFGLDYSPLEDALAESSLCSH